MPHLAQKAAVTLNADIEVAKYGPMPLFTTVGVAPVRPIKPAVCFDNSQEIGSESEAKLVLLLHINQF